MPLQAEIGTGRRKRRPYLIGFGWASFFALVIALFYVDRAYDIYFLQKPFLVILREALAALLKVVLKVVMLV